MTIYKAAERKVIKDAQTGKIREYILDEKLFGGVNTLYAQITLPQGVATNYHEHHGNNETYYIMQGTGIYNDDGKEYPVQKGDVTFCPDGSGHSLNNTGKENLVFIPLIATSPKN